MVRCGVNLFGFDQFLPNDGRILGSIWSWAKDQPKRSDGRCAAQGTDGRWVTRPCTGRHRAACRIGDGWRMTARSFDWSSARAACRRNGGRLGLPHSGDDNSLLRAAAGRGDVWLAYRLP
jgi:hypothetical protein